MATIVRFLTVLWECTLSREAVASRALEERAIFQTFIATLLPPRWGLPGPQTLFPSSCSFFCCGRHVQCERHRASPGRCAAYAPSCILWTPSRSLMSTILWWQAISLRWDSLQVLFLLAEATCRNFHWDFCYLRMNLSFFVYVMNARWSLLMIAPIHLSNGVFNF